VEAVQGPGHAAGYVNACGTVEAREAVAAFHSSTSSNVHVTAENVVLANGCSGYVHVQMNLSCSSILDCVSALFICIYSAIADHILHFLVSFS
jgi:predicted transcriptional regulator